MFTQLRDTSYDDRAVMQIAQAEQLAAQENRRKAAELFVRANATRETDKRIELLLESRELLLAILEKYPQSDLVEKVQRNLSRIEEEISAIDPALLESLPEKDTAGGMEGMPFRPATEEYRDTDGNVLVDPSMQRDYDLQE